MVTVIFQSISSKLAPLSLGCVDMVVAATMHSGMSFDARRLLRKIDGARCKIIMVFRSFRGWLEEAGRLVGPGRPVSVLIGGAV